MIALKVEQLSSSIYVLSADRMCNIGVCIRENKALVIDASGSPVYGRAIKDTLRNELGSEAELLFLTHYHSDHTFGNQVFDCPIIAAAQCHLMMEQCLTTHWHSSEIEQAKRDDPFLAEVWKGLKITLPTDTFNGERELDFHGQKALLRTLPGHSHDSTIVYFPAEKILFAGDTVFGRRYPTMLEHDAEPYCLIDSLNEIKSMDIDRIVPGHGKVDDKTLIDLGLIYWSCLTVKGEELFAAGIGADNAMAQLLDQCHLEGIPYDNFRHRRNINSIVKYFSRKSN